MALNYMYTQPNGVVAIVRAAPKVMLEEQLGPLTNAQYKKAVLERSIPADAVNVREVSDANIPSDRKYREAWVDVSVEPKVDLHVGKIRDLLLQNMRRDRVAILAVLDVEALRALEAGLPIAAIVAKKAQLRTATDALKDAVIADNEVNDNIKIAELEAAAILPTV